VGSFVAELAHRLQGLSLTLPLTWIAQRLSESNLTIEQMVHRENQQQAADQVSISNSIGSLRILGATDWRKFVESLSTVEQTLREDPAEAYRGMEFATRDHYRRTVEAIAKRSLLAESEVARQAILLAQNGAARGASDARMRHVGFYLIDQGLPQLEQAFLNLILNAAEAMADGGTLSVKSRAVHQPRTSERPTHVALEFKDTGRGMSEELQKRAFTAVLSSTKAKGTGLGLAIVSRIIETHRGSIRIKSQIGRGTSIRVLLPVM